MKSIAFRLWAYIIVLILLLLGVLWVLQTGLLNEFYVNKETDNIKRDTRALASIKAPQDLYELGNEVEALARAYDAMVVVIDERGRVAASAGRVMRGLAANIEASEFPNVLMGSERIVTNGETQSGMQIVTIGIPVKYKDNVVGAVFVHTPYSSIEETLRVLKNQFFIVSIIAILIATLGAFVLSRRFTGPILEINKAADAISEGKFDARVDIKYKDEIGRLGDTINRMASELSKVEGLRRDLVANISHEFRTPLGIIRSYGEGLLDGVYEDEKEREEYIRIILDEASRLSSLVDDVLDISKLQSGNMKVEILEFSLSSLVGRVYDKFRVLAEKRGIKINLDSPDNLHAMGDEARIEQVMINLLNNSLNHTDSGGTISIRAIIKDKIVIEVEDTGSGIPKEDITYVFDRFYKADKTGKKSIAGTGLGLSIVKEILKSHQSHFGVESQVGVGTKFYFTLLKA